MVRLSIPATISSSTTRMKRYKLTICVSRYHAGGGRKKGGAMFSKLSRYLLGTLGILVAVLGLTACNGYVYVGHGTFYDPWWYYHPPMSLPPVVLWGMESTEVPAAVRFDKGDFKARAQVKKNKIHFYIMSSTDLLDDKSPAREHVFTLKLKQFEKIKSRQTLWLAAQRSGLAFDVRAELTRRPHTIKLEFLDPRTGQLKGVFEGQGH